MNGVSRAIVFGAAGQLGTALAAYLERHQNPRFEVIRVTRREVDVTDSGALERRIADLRPAIVANCTGYNDVDGAERDAARALSVNAFAVRSMVRAAARIQATLVHYSTDFVFDGEAFEPYREDDRALPLSVYGASKLLGEWFAAASPQHYILRVESLFGGSHRRSGIDRIITALEEGREAHVFHDRIVTPSYVDDVTAATVALLRTGASAGVYHCVNTGSASWYEVGGFIANELRADDSLLKRASVHDIRLPAARPVFCALSNSKLLRAGVPMPGWQDAVRRYLAQRQMRQPGVEARTVM
jgi:dTDP-4-dehydrorhamnose reductase